MNDIALSPRLLHEDATERLRDMIVQGELAPGAKLVERVLCERLVVSRTPLREGSSGSPPRAVAGGANILCFTTGRGSAYGCKPTPSIKLVTNTPMYERMVEDMDINCGDILDGVTVQEKGQEIFDLILRVASGEQSKSEQLGYGDNEFVPWQIEPPM